MIVSKDLIIKSFDTGFQLSVWLSNDLITWIKTKISTIKSINTKKKLDSDPWLSKNFFSSQNIFSYLHTVESFLNLVLWVVCQERGKLGTVFWRHTNFSWQGKPICNKFPEIGSVLGWVGDLTTSTFYFLRGDGWWTSGPQKHWCLL
jgi:hypothetical protein